MKRTLASLLTVFAIFASLSGLSTSALANTDGPAWD